MPLSFKVFLFFMVVGYSILLLTSPIIRKSEATTIPNLPGIGKTDSGEVKKTSLPRGKTGINCEVPHHE